MKILHVDETFHPSFGYQCNPLAKFQSKAGHDVSIIAPDANHIYFVYDAFGIDGSQLEKEDQEYEALSGVKIVRVPAKGWIMSRLNYDMRALYAAIDRIAPDVIMVHCIETLTGIRLLRSLKNKYPMVFDSHMLAMASGNKFAKLFELGFRLVCTPIIKKEGYMVIKTQNDDYINSHLGIPEKQSKFISFGTDTSIFCPNEKIKRDFLKDNNLPDDTFVVVSTGKLNAAKGGKLLSSAVKEQFHNRPVAIVIVAAFPGEYEKEVYEELKSSQNKVLFYPVQKYLNLPRFYQIADLVVFPKQCSMSFYDAQACGCPVVSENVRVNVDRNSHGNGFVFDSNHSYNLREVIQQAIDMPQKRYDSMKANSYQFVKDHYSYDAIAEEYTNEMVRAIKNYSERRRRGNRR